MKLTHFFSILILLCICLTATSQNVGIGTTTPVYKLQVFQDADTWQLSVGGATGVLKINGQAGSNTVLQSWHPNLNFARNLVLQRDGGNVGIATTSPVARLHVAGNQVITFTSTLVSPTLTLEQTNNDFSRLLFKNVNGNSFTLAAVKNPNGSSDYFNIYSEANGIDYFQVTTDPKQNVRVNGSLVLKTVSIDINNMANDINTLDIGDASVVFLNNDGLDAKLIRGFSGGITGRYIHVISYSLPAITLKAHSISGGVEALDDIVLPFKGGATFVYQTGLQFLPGWFCVGRY
jgi:hypothetical protein